MKKIKAKITKTLAKAKVVVGKSFENERSLMILAAVQKINREYGDEKRGVTPLFIQNGRVLMSEKYFA